LPEHAAVTSAHRADDPQPDDVLCTVDRVPRVDPPPPDDSLNPWLTGPLDEPDDPPGARQAVEFGGASVEMSADVHERYLGWFARWQEWAERERKDRLVRAVYGQLFSAYVTASGNPEELELVLGTGCLAWTPPGH